MSFSLLQIRAFTLGLLLILLAYEGVEVFAKDKLVAAVTRSGDVSYLTVAFLDVGQGDAIYIETPDGVQLLIDGGPDSSVLRELSSQLPHFDRTIDIVLATHSDKDHIGGLVDVLNRYEVGSIITTNNKNDTSIAETFSELVQLEGADLYTAQAAAVSAWCFHYLIYIVSAWRPN